MNIFRKLNIDPFLLGLIAMVALALIWPTPGVSGGVLHFDYATTYGVSIVFFLYGLTLSFEKMKAGIMLWKLHVAVQLATFLLFPAIVLVARWLVPGLMSDDLWLGFFYVAALPSTVSSSVAMTNIARGNVPAAVFNASLSSFLGVFLTPAWMSWYMSRNGIDMPLMPVILKVTLLVLVPIIVGQIARHWLADWAKRNARWVKLADRTTILAIVYNSFCDSVAAGVWNTGDLLDVVKIAALSIALFLIVYAIMDLVCSLLGFDMRDRIACQFCGSKKSLATGAPLAKVVFGATSSLGLLIAPIMMFHFLQLVMVSWLAARFSRRMTA
jgi:solute carrier family 10 (sodium/bile acid cotransporter), member 7